VIWVGQADQRTGRFQDQVPDARPIHPEVRKCRRGTAQQLRGAVSALPFGWDQDGFLTQSDGSRVDKVPPFLGQSGYNSGCGV